MGRWKLPSLIQQQWEVKEKSPQTSQKGWNWALKRVSGCASLSDGVEEVFASVGESVSVSCHHTSSLDRGGSMEWSVGGAVLRRGSLSLVIGKVSALHAAEYQCSDSSDQRRVFNRIRLQTLEGECANTGPNPELCPTPSTFHILFYVCLYSESWVRGRWPHLDLCAHLRHRVWQWLQFILEGRWRTRLAEHISER